MVSPTDAHEPRNVLLFTTGVSRKRQHFSCGCRWLQEGVARSALRPARHGGPGILENGSGVTVVPLGAD